MVIENFMVRALRAADHTYHNYAAPNRRDLRRRLIVQQLQRRDDRDRSGAQINRFAHNAIFAGISVGVC